MEKKSEKLSLFSLVCIAAGNVIGAGIITTTGLAIAKTGRSVWISYFLAILFGFLWLLPTCFFASCAKYKGGAYAQIGTLMGPKAAGIYSLWWLPMFLMQGMMGLALGMYISSVIPALSPKVAGIIGVTIFFVLNLFGVNSMAKLQNPMTVFLLICLLSFAVVGFGNLNEGAFAIGSSDYYLNGGIGLLDGLMLLIYSTGGHSLVTGCSWEAKNPKRDIPLAIIITTGILVILYCSVSFVAGNVLPVADVAGQPLTYVAKAIFPGALFLVFIIGGPIMALATSTNSGFMALSAPVHGAIRNGWLPEGIAKTNKYGAPWIIYTIMYLIALSPLVLGVSLSALTAYTVLTMRITSILGILSAFYIPTKMKDAWEKSWMHVPNGVFYAICGLSLATNLIAAVLNVRTISLPVFMLNLLLVAALAAFALYRYKAGKVKFKVICTTDENAEE